MKWVRRLLALALVAACAVWAWTVFFPSPEKIIIRRLNHLARQVSFSDRENDLTRLGKIGSVTGFFANEVELKLDFRDTVLRRTITHEGIQAGTATIRVQQPEGIKVELLDPQISLPPGGEFASAELTMKATTPGERDFNMQEMRVALRKVNDVWLIYRVETIRTLK
jgi:hypothetical protein